MQDNGLDVYGFGLSPENNLSSTSWTHCWSVTLGGQLRSRARSVVRMHRSILAGSAEPSATLRAYRTMLPAHAPALLAAGV